MASAKGIRLFILGLLTRQPMSGYDIKRFLKSLSWLIDVPSLGSLYPSLHALLKDGLVTVEVIASQDRPSRKIYSITEAGEKALRAWLNQPSESDASLKKFVMRLALINAISVLDDVKMAYPDEQTGVKILRVALEMPIRKISENAGEDGAVILDTARRVQKEKKNTRIGYDVITGEFVDMVEAGIIDPAKVTKGALSNAASIAAMILSTEALVTDIPEPEPPAPAGPPGGGMY